VKKKNRRLKRIYGVSTILLALLVLFIPRLTRAADEVQGTDGGIEYVISGDTITFSENAAAAEEEKGIIPDHNSENPAPWLSQPEFADVRNVILSNTIKQVGTNTLVDFAGDKITIAGSVTTVKSGFANKVVVSEVEFQDGVTTIAGDAFTNGSKAGILRFPQTVTDVNLSNFYLLSQTAGGDPAYVYSTTDVYGYPNTAAVTFTDTINNAVLTQGPVEIDSNNTYINNDGGRASSGFETIIVFHPLEGDAPAPALTIIDRRTNKDNTSAITGSVTELTENLYMFFENPPAEADSELVKKVTLKTGGALERFSIRLVKANEEAATQFGTATLTYPIPAAWNLEKGKVKAITVGADSNLEELTTTIDTVGEVKVAKFDVTHFSEFGLLYEANEEGGGGGQGGGGEGGGGQGGGDSNSTQSNGNIGGNTGTNTGTNEGGTTGGNTGNNEGGNTSGNTNTAQPGDVNASPTNNITLNADGTPVVMGGGGEGSVIVGKGNVGDMPKTGVEDIPRYLLIGVLLIFGCIQLLSTVQGRKKVKEGEYPLD